MRRFPNDLLRAAYCKTEEVLGELAAADEDFADVLGPWKEFKNGVQQWHGTNELEYMNFVAGAVDPDRPDDFCDVVTQECTPQPS